MSSAAIGSSTSVLSLVTGTSSAGGSPVSANKTPAGPAAATDSAGAQPFISKPVPFTPKESSEDVALLRYMSSRAPSAVTKFDLEAVLPFDSKERKINALVSRILSVFGLHHSEGIERELRDRAVKTRFGEMRTILVEIQNGLRSGKTAYSPDDFPETAERIVKWCPTSVSIDTYFAQLKKYSYGILSCPAVVLDDPQPDLPILEGMEEAKGLALGHMSRFLKRSDPPRQKPAEDSKGPAALSVEVSPPSPPRPIPEQDQLNVTQLYYNGSVFVNDGQEIYFSDLLHWWETLDPDKNSPLKETFLGQLSVSGWVKGQELKPIPTFLAAVGRTPRPESPLSFRDYVIACSIAYVKKTLGMVFSPELEEIIKTAFQLEATRSDVCYFLRDIPHFYDVDLTKYKTRPSYRLLHSLQLMIYFARCYGNQRKNQDPLLQMLLSRNNVWTPTEPFQEAFAKRSWSHQIVPKETEELSKAWAGIHLLLAIVPREEKRWTDPHCCALFFYLLENGNRDGIVQIFSALGANPQYRITVPIMSRFCAANPFPFEQDQRDFFIEIHGLIAKKFFERRLEINNLQLLLLDPPLEDLRRRGDDFSMAALNTGRFLDYMQNYPSFPIGDRFLFLLRHLIFHPTSLIFEILLRNKDIGIKNYNETFLWEVLHVWHERFTDEIVVYPEEECEKAKQLLANLQDKYQFTDVQLFLLYLEFIRIVIDREEEEVHVVSEIVCALQEFCPALSRNTIFFLFRYHKPEWNRGQIDALKSKWQALEGQAHRFIIPPELTTSILLSIRTLSNIFAPAPETQYPEAATPGQLERRNAYENESQVFRAAFEKAVESSYWPPLQPLTDAFKITGLSAAGGVRYGTPIDKTRLGQFKLILQNASVGVYCHWHIRNDMPLFFFSFFDTGKNVAFSSFVPLEVSTLLLGEDKKRAAFWTALIHLSQHVLKEEVDNSPLDSAPDTPETWVQCYDNQNEWPEYVEAMKAAGLDDRYESALWDFLKRVKSAYRMAFHRVVIAQQSLSFPSSQPRAIAAYGNIFSSHSQGALIPPAQLITPHPECYTPDANERTIAEYQASGIFKKTNEKPQLLKLDLQVTIDDYTVQKFPISYRVQTLEDLFTLEEMDAMRGDHLDREGTYVTLSVDVEGDDRKQTFKAPLRYTNTVLNDPRLFRTYFNFQNLILKGVVYNLLFPPRE